MDSASAFQMIMRGGEHAEMRITTSSQLSGFGFVVFKLILVNCQEACGCSDTKGCVGAGACGAVASLRHFKLHDLSDLVFHRKGT